MMNKEVDWSKISSCSTETCKDLVIYIEQLIALKHNFEKDGIVGFRHFISNSKNIFEKVALHLIMEGCMPEMCRTILYNLLSASNLKNHEYLKDVVFTEFVLMLQEKEVSDSYIRKMLLSYLGMKCANEILNS